MSMRMSDKLGSLLAGLVLLGGFALSISAAPAQQVYSQNAEANALFLKAREYFSKSDPRVAGGKLANAREAIRLYEQAVQKDPKFALAYVEMARAWSQLAYSDPDGASANEVLPHARAALRKAIALDPKLTDAHLALAVLYFGSDYNWSKAEREYRLALRLAPSNARAHVSYAAYLSSMGHFAEALDETKKADELAPSFVTDITFTRILYSQHRYEEAAEYCRRALKKEDNVLGHFFLGFINVAQEKYEEAIAEFKLGTRFSNNAGAFLGLAYGYAMAGKRDEALEIVEQMKRNNQASLVPYRVAAVYVALGDNDQAIEWLRKDYEARSNWITQLKIDPVMDPLRKDPRFKQLMRQMKFKDSSGSVRRAVGINNF
jgi:tetratricopeptide (TPR) repeat protein